MIKFPIIFIPNFFKFIEIYRGYKIFEYYKFMIRGRQVFTYYTVSKYKNELKEKLQKESN